MRSIKKGLLLATATATLILTTTSLTAANESSAIKPVKCYGINSCRGKAQCGSKANACAGQNTCKGKGWIYIKSAQECTNKGGKIVK